MPTVSQVLEAITARFVRVGVPSPRVDAEWLLEHVLGWSRSHLRLEAQHEIAPGVEETLEPLVQRREAREPLQWILGVTEFYGLGLRVQPGVLIPRPETERLVELVLPIARGFAAPRVVDVGTGTGAIALAIKHECPQAQVRATDVNGIAVNLALENAARLGLAVEVRLGSILADLEGPFEVIVSNPPYLPERDAATLEPEVQAEPPEALFSGADGLELTWQIVQVARQRLAPDGWLALELDPRNVHELAYHLGEAGWAYRVEADLTGRERFVLATPLAG